MPNLQWRHRIGPLEAVGFSPLRPALRDCKRVLLGDQLLEPAKWGLSSLKIFNPRLGLRTWLGLRDPSGQLPVFNLYNRRAAPRDEGYDVRVTEVLDYRGRQVTYNSHRGVDFAVPVGTTVRAPAAGRVVVVENLIYHGGLKVVLDHGGGLISVAEHLARPLVEAGDRLRCGDAIGLSGYSAIDGVISFPWIPPHLHFTVLHNGEPADPHATPGETSLWLEHNDPRPAAGTAEDHRPTRWDRDGVSAGLAALRDEPRRAQIAAIEDDDGRAAMLAYWRFYNYAAFDAHPPLIDAEHRHDREPRLALPFGVETADGCYVIER
jgi:murein DD-endopeptidase MepM/ murein hydrolase activator NlpD